ncbi:MULTISPECIES: hypothetical protein [unclassified Microbacterium]|uniref:hypothetical protein n=1 Tax=unclassified Microbacterium TaxID=2609290 RepID=UPI00386A92CB
MSSELPRTAVPIGITDPVERARAELKAALMAIEEKANVPKRAAHATQRASVAARRYADRNPTGAAAAAVGAALAVGALVWGAVRLYTR